MIYHNQNLRNFYIDTKLSKYILFIIVFLCCNGYLYGELPSIYSYPPQYEKITEHDWENTKKQIDVILSYSKLNAIEPELFFDVSYKIIRFSQIKISDNRKNEISNFMLDSIIKMLQQERFLEGSFPDQGEDIEMVSEQKRYGLIIFKMLYCYGKIAITFDNNKFSELWNILTSKDEKQSQLINGIKLSIFTIVEIQIKSKNTLLFLQKLGDASKINETEKRRIDNLIDLHSYAIIPDETLLWQTFWNRNKPNDLNDVFKLDFINKIFSKTWLLIRVLQSLNYQIPLDISETCTNLQDKYIFVLFSNFIAMNILNSLEKPSDSFIIFFSKLEIATNKLTNDIKIKYPNFLSNNMINYNQDLFYENQNKLEKIKGYYEKKRIEEERLRQQSNSHANINYETTITRPEDQGEDFSLLDNVENFKRLTTSADKFARWKAAKVLGTRFIEGKFTPTEDEQKKINEYVEYLLTQFKTDNPGDAGDASSQFWRLWGLAIPGLFEGLKSKDRKTWNVALAYLVILRNENVVKKLIYEYDNSKDTEYKKVLLDTIGKMRTMYDNPFSYRKMMSSKKSRELSDKLIVPFLDRISVTEKDSVEELQNVLKEAKKFIADPPDSRAYLVNPKTGEKKLMIPEPPDDEPLPPPPTNNKASLKIHLSR